MTILRLLLVTLLLVPLHVRAADLYFVHTDELGTPQTVTDESKNVVWRRDQAPFGDEPAQSGPIELNLRFPGQYNDAETGLNYNYFRTYDPTTGRYLTSDPIGLSGGINPYLYGNANPLSYIDPTGELSIYEIAVPVGILVYLGATYYANLNSTEQGIGAAGASSCGSCDDPRDGPIFWADFMADFMGMPPDDDDGWEPPRVENHHLISHYQPRLRNHPLIRGAKVNIAKDPGNMVRMSGHRSAHSPTYHRGVERILDDYLARATRAGGTTDVCRVNYYRALEEIKRQITAGKLRPYTTRIVRIVE